MFALIVIQELPWQLSIHQYNVCINNQLPELLFCCVTAKNNTRLRVAFAKLKLKLNIPTILGGPPGPGLSTHVVYMGVERSPMDCWCESRWAGGEILVWHFNGSL